MPLDTGILHVRYKRCATCIFSARSPISPAALAERSARIEAEGGYQECHAYTLRHGRHRGAGVCCRGWFDERHTLAVILARALGVIRFVDDDGQEVAGE